MKPKTHNKLKLALFTIGILGFMIGILVMAVHINIGVGIFIGSAISAFISLCMNQLEENPYQ